MAKVDVGAHFINKRPQGKTWIRSTGHQRYRCQDCCRCFQLDYKYRACQLGTKDKVIDLMMNNACIRDTARALHISINAVVRTLKNMLIYQIKLKTTA